MVAGSLLCSRLCSDETRLLGWRHASISSAHDPLAQSAGGLGGEKARWTEQAESLDQQYNHLIGDMLVSASTIAYTGPFTSTYRSGVMSALLEMCK